MAKNAPKKAVHRNETVFRRLAREYEQPMEAAARVRLITNIGFTRHPSAVKLLKPDLDHSDFNVKNAAAVAIGRIGTPRAQAALVSFVHAPSEFSFVVAKALAPHKHPAAAGPLFEHFAQYTGSQQSGDTLDLLRGIRDAKRPAKGKDAQLLAALDAVFRHLPDKPGSEILKTPPYTNTAIAHAIRTCMNARNRAHVQHARAFHLMLKQSDANIQRAK